MERVLSNITDAMRLQDKLVIGIERADLQNSRWLENIMKTYNSNEVIDVFMATLEEL
jgi:hypothetical protein